MTTSAIAQKGNSNPYTTIANNLVRDGEYGKALVQYNKAIEFSPRVADNYTLRGYAKDMTGDYEGGITDFTTAINLNKKDAVAYGNRGYAYSMVGEDLMAIQDYTVALKLNPNFNPTYSNRALVYTKLSLYNEALTDLNVAITRAEQPNPSLHNLKGYCLYSTGKSKLAIEEYSKAIELDSIYADAYFNRGVARYASGDKNGAYRDFITAKRIGHPEADMWLLKYKPTKNHS